jgi:phage tail sheath gpL-like
MRERVQLLTCDRCGTVTVLKLDTHGDYYESPPEGWTGMMHDHKGGELCPSCSAALESFMKNEWFKSCVRSGTDEKSLAKVHF